MTDENKDYVVKLTADTQQFVSDVKDADKVVNDMLKHIASSSKLVKGMSDVFKSMSIDAKSIGAELAKGFAEAQKELDKVMKTASKSASGASDMQISAKSAKDAAKAMREAGEDVAKSAKDTGKTVADIGKKMGGIRITDPAEAEKQKKINEGMLGTAKQLTAEEKKITEEKNKQAAMRKVDIAMGRPHKPGKTVDAEYFETGKERFAIDKERMRQANREAKRNQGKNIRTLDKNDFKSWASAETQMRKLSRASEVFHNTATLIRAKLNPAWAETERQVARLSARYDEIMRQREKIANTRYHSDEWESYTKEINNSRSAINALGIELQVVERERLDVLNNKKSTPEDIEAVEQRYADVAGRIHEMGEELSKYMKLRQQLGEGGGLAGTKNPEYTALTNMGVDLQRQMRMTRLSRKSLLSNLFKHTRSDAKKLSTVLKNTYSKIKSFFSKVLHLSSNRSSERGLKRIADAFTRLWGMFRTRLKRRFISAVFEDAKHDMVQLAKAFPSMNDAISNVVNSAKQLGAQLISILQPIITAVGPLVTKVLDAATVAADKIAQFSAKLFGQNLYGKATKGNYDFVKSMDETSNSISDANNALTDYSSNLLGFDKLNQLQAVDNSKASISAVNTDPVSENAFNKWAEELNELYKNKDWRGFGAKLAEGLNTAVKWINSQDWDALSDKVTGFIANIQKGFNGFIDAFDAEGVGEAIAHIGNLIIDAWNQLVKPVEEGGFNTYELGKKIGTIIVTALKDIKWDEAGQALGNTGSRLVEMFRGILETKFTDAEGEHTLGYGIGKAISTFITNALKSINTDDWATIIADLFENLLDMFIQIFSSGPELGAKIAEILNKSLKKIPANKLGEAISGLSRTFNSLMDNIQWGDVASKFSEALSSIDVGSVLKSIFYIRMGKGVGKVASGLFGSLLGGGSGGSSAGLLAGLTGIIKNGVSLALIATLAGWLITSSKESAEAAAKDANERGDVITTNEKEDWLAGPREDSDAFERGVSKLLADLNLTVGSWFSPEIRKLKERSDFANKYGYVYNPVETPFENPWDSDEKLANINADGQTAALTETISNNTAAMQSTKVSNDASSKAMSDAALQMKALVDSMSQDANDGQPLTLMVDSYKLGEIVLKTVGTLMHTRIATP